MGLNRKHIPFLLIYSRIVIALIFLLMAFSTFFYRDETIVILLIVGVATDFFDGVLARKWNVSSEKLRVWDSNADQVFWLAAIFNIFYLNVEFITTQWMSIVIVLVLEFLAYLVSYIRFKKSVATHSLLAKLWTVTLLLFLIDLCLFHSSTWVYWACITLGIVSRGEIIGILLLLKNWTTDVPSILYVKRINAGLPIKKNKWFNS